MTKAQAFVPSAMQQLQSIKAQMIALQSAAIALNKEYTQLGGAVMEGLAAFDFSPYNCTLTEFTTGMTDLSTTHNAVSLSTLHSAGAFDDVTNLAVG